MGIRPERIVLTTPYGLPTIVLHYNRVAMKEHSVSMITKYAVLKKSIMNFCSKWSIALTIVWTNSIICFLTFHLGLKGHETINYIMLLFAFLFLSYSNVSAKYLLFPKSSQVEIPCDDRRAQRCSFVHCDLLALQKASSIIIPQPPFQNKVFARKMQWTVKGQFLTEFEVSLFPILYIFLCQNLEIICTALWLEG